MENFNQTNNNCVMRDLVGKTVTGLSLSFGESLLVVTHNEGSSVYETWGDCCSETWIADIVGVSNLIGQKVLKAEDVDMPDVEDGRSRQEYDLFFGIKLTTTRGYVDIVYRNSSNGYYGGGLSKGDHQSVDEAELRAITEDFSA